MLGDSLEEAPSPTCVDDARGELLDARAPALSHRARLVDVAHRLERAHRGEEHLALALFDAPDCVADRERIARELQRGLGLSALEPRA